MEHSPLSLRGSPTPEPLEPSEPSQPFTALDHVSPDNAGRGSGSGSGRPPRKNHKKSRRGCFSCKKRRVKCPETYPICTNCLRLGLACEYPQVNSEPSAPLQSVGTLFTIHDFRLFHHFMFHAHPPLPFQGSTVWKEVAAISHHFDCLTHAMLGLAASHLTTCSGVDYRTQALTHRVAAMRALNQTLSKRNSSEIEWDALYGTLMLLGYQATYMPDGMSEMISMVRGVMILTGSRVSRFNGSVFLKFSWQSKELSAPRLNRVTSENDHQSNSMFDGASFSIKALRPLCQTSTEVRLLDAMENILKITKNSFIDSLSVISMAYNLFGQISQSEFNKFMDSSNHIAQLLMLHFFILEYLVGLKAPTPIMMGHPFKTIVITSMVKTVKGKIPSRYKEYTKWPTEFVESITPKTSILSDVSV